MTFFSSEISLPWNWHESWTAAKFAVPGVLCRVGRSKLARRPEARPGMIRKTCCRPGYYNRPAPVLREFWRDEKCSTSHFLVPRSAAVAARILALEFMTTLWATWVFFILHWHVEFIWFPVVRFQRPYLDCPCQHRCKFCGCTVFELFNG